MLDIKYIMDNVEAVQKNADNRNVKIDIAALVAAYKEKVALQQKIEALRVERNQVSKSIQKASNEERPAIIERGKQLKEDIAKLEEDLPAMTAAYEETLGRVPNMTHPDSPLGKTDEDNKEIARFGEPVELGFPAKDHVELGAALDIIDFESATKVSGAKFYFLKNEAVLLEQAITRFALDLLMENGFTLVATPDLARKEILEGTGFNPRGEETQVYSIENSDLCLIGTAEITLAGMHADSILDEEQLPIKYAGVSHCFRTEAGSYGQFSKGLYRVHQFTKIEMFAFTRPSESAAMHEHLRELEEQFYQKLGLAFRTVDICTGDLGGPAYRKYDLEAWMPGRSGGDDEGGSWGEITSTSNCTDYQSRRLNIKYRSKETGKAELVHTLNGTAFALSRTILAILENFQQEDGSIKMPEALHKYLGFTEIRRG